MSGDELFRPKASVVRRSDDRSRASVVRPPDFFVPVFEGPRVIDPQQFIEEFRRKVGMKPGEPMYTVHFGDAVTNYPALIPVLIYNPGGTWDVVREVRTTSIEVYSPRVGLYEIGNPQNDKFWYLQPDTQVALGFSIRRNPALAIVDRYYLPREPLVRLGPIQQDPLNCGPLVMYAALVAKGHIKSP